MPLYVCDSCNAIENTTQGNFYEIFINVIKPPYKCSECFTGEWHGKFEKIIASEEILRKKFSKSNFEYLGKFENAWEINQNYKNSFSFF